MGVGELFRRIVALVASLTSVLALAACSTAEPAATGMPTSSETAPTDASRLAEAIDAFTIFNAALDGYVSGSSSVDTFEALVTPEYLQTLRSEDREYSQRQEYTVGTSSFSDEKLVDPADWGEFGDTTLVVCRDISRTRVVDEEGAPSTSTPIRTRIPTVVFFVHDGDSLLISKVDQWNEDGYCS